MNEREVRINRRNLVLVPALSVINHLERRGLSRIWLRVFLIRLEYFFLTFFLETILSDGDPCLLVTTEVFRLKAQDFRNVLDFNMNT